MRRAQASSDDSNLPSVAGSVRVAMSPSWWQPMQPLFLISVEPIGQLGLFRNVAFAAELISGRDLQHRVPVDRRIILRGRRIVRRRHRGQVELFARIGFDHGRIDQAVAAHPHFVMCLRKIGHDVAALVVGDDHLGVAGCQIVCLRDHPNAGFRSVRTGDHAANVVIVDLHRLRLRRRPDEPPGKANRRRARIQAAPHRHDSPPWICLVKNLPECAQLCNGVSRCPHHCGRVSAGVLNLCYDRKASQPPRHRTMPTR